MRYSWALFCAGALLTHGAPAPGDLESIYPVEGAIVEHPFLDPATGGAVGKTRLIYRPNVAGDTHQILNIGSIASAATAYKDRMQALIAGGSHPDDYIPDDNNAPERSQKSDGVYIHLDPPNFMTRTTIENVQWLCESLIAASTNTTVTPKPGASGFVEESRIAYDYWKDSVLALWIPVANVQLRAAVKG